MVESGLIAEGSLNGLLKGTHFSRCKKIHPVAAQAFKILHFKEFMKEYDVMDHSSKMSAEEVLEILERDHGITTMDRTFFELKDIMERYKLYTQKTLNGDHGYTAKYTMQYVSLVELYQLFERAIRLTDLELYIYAAYEMCSMFFTFNHQNYARWLSRHLDALMNIDTTHPGLIDEFESGAFCIRRTIKNFCRTPVDLTLEQTVNADAANKLGGIAAFTNKIGTRQRWSATHSNRAAIITQLLESLNLTKYADSTDSEYNSKIFRKKLSKFSDELIKSMNPFDKNLKNSTLFNLCTGKAASPETAEFLLQAFELGSKQMKSFITECQSNVNRFVKPIKRNTIKNFAAETPNRTKTSKRYFDQAKAERNILGKVLCLALKNEIDLGHLLSYPLTRVPHSLAHFDGTMISNVQKSELSTIFMSRGDYQHFDNSNDFDADIVDGFYLLNGLREVPVKFGHISTAVLNHLCSTSAQEIHVIFDKYDSPSPRDVHMKKDRDLYDDLPAKFTINGPNQERTTSLVKCLSNPSFKEELVEFFKKHWSQDEVSNEILGEKRLFFSHGRSCHLFCNKFEKGQKLQAFENDHFEVETKMMFHMSKLRTTNIRVRTPNPDTVLVYSLYHMQFWPNERKVIIESGDILKKTVQKIDVRQIYNPLSPVFINALPGWFIFTGCMYEPSFYGKGKKTCLKTLEKSIDFQTAFGDMGSDNTMFKMDSTRIIEEFTCSLYNSKSVSVNEARKTIFENAYGSHNTVDFSKKGTFKKYSRSWL